MNQETLAPRTVFQGRYEILSLLRESRLAVVYQGRQPARLPPALLEHPLGALLQRATFEWTVTTCCMPVERRVELLRVPEPMARADREACLRRVEAARAAALESQPDSAGSRSPHYKTNAGARRGA